MSPKLVETDQCNVFIGAVRRVCLLPSIILDEYHVNGSQ